MKHVVVLGGGPAGAYTAERLSRSGLRTTVVDEKLAWEKPCGGGLTYKAYSQYPFLLNNATPKKFVTSSILSTPGAGAVDLKLEQPLLIYSRFELNSLLLSRAEQAGAAVEKTRVTGLERSGARWKVRTRQGAMDADFVVVATGARNPLRQVGTELTAEDAMPALGYYVPGDQDHIDIEFPKGLEGYIWVFPRCGHLSIGICGKGQPATALRKQLEDYMDRHGYAWRGSPFYGHVLPSLDTPAWKRNRVGGEGWMAVGDAAGLVDPITGEGLYYAVRSADLASTMLAADEASSLDYGAAYRKLLRKDFMLDLEFASRLAKRVFLGRFLFGSVPERMIQFTRRSPRFSTLMQDLFAGTQPYLGLKSRLMNNLNGSLFEIAMSFGFSRVVPRTVRP